MDLFHKKELASLKSELTRLKGLIPDEAIDKADFLLSLDDKIAQKNQELSKLDEAIALRKGLYYTMKKLIGLFCVFNLSSVASMKIQKI